MVCRMLVKKPTFTIVILERDCNRMGIVRAGGQDPETCRQLFILVAEILGVAAVSVGFSRLKPAAPTAERATVRTDTVKRDPMLRQMLDKNGNCRLMTHLCAKLSETSPIWRRAVLPVAEWIAQVLWSSTGKSTSKEATLPTRLTQRRRTEGRGKE